MTCVYTSDIMTRLLSKRAFVLTTLSPWKFLLLCYRILMDLTHADRTDQLPSLPTNLQSHKCPLLGILKNTQARTDRETNKLTDLFLISSYHNCVFCFLLLYLFLYSVVPLPVAECW